jgi:hypothetical protein
MVVRPHDAYDEEADRVCQIRRPQVREFVQERSMLSDVGTPISMMRSVIAMANTPSEKTSILPVSLSPPPLAVIGLPLYVVDC